jgi:hypothetical protein
VRGRRWLLRAGAAAGLTCLSLGASAIAGAGAASGDTSTTAAPSIAGYVGTAQALGIQFAFNVPDLIPLPNQNLLEDDIPFSRTLVENGPVVDALGAPYYPGDVAADVGTLLKTFGVPLPVPNDTALAEAKYPTSPGYGATASFGVPAPAGSPVTPNLATASTAASANGGISTATLSDVSLGVPGVSLLDIASIQSTNSIQITPSAIVGTANSLIKSIDIAGILDITELQSAAGATSDGTTGTPTASLRLGQVTIAGVPGYIDASGVHVDGQTESVDGVTPRQAQLLIDNTFSQDGISVRLSDPTTTTMAAQGAADSGALVISFTHQLDLPALNGVPPLPSLPGLGTVSVPAGLYTVTTSITLGSAVTNVTATPLASFNHEPISSAGLGGIGGGLGGLSLGGGGLSSTFPSAASTLTTLAPSGPGATTSAPTVTPTAVVPLFDRFPLGIPAPVGWIIAALVLCILVAYPLLLIARWQYVGGRRR